MSEVTVHPTAIVDPAARLGAGTVLGRIASSRPECR